MLQKVDAKLREGGRNCGAIVGVAALKANLQGRWQHVCGGVVGGK